MYSIYALKRALTHPIFTIISAITYIAMYKDIIYIKESLKSRFSQEDFKRYSIGGSAGLKEVALYVLVRKYKPKLIVETGVANGFSTYFILKAIHKNGHGKLISIDYPNYDKNGYITSEGKVDNVYIPAGLEPGWIVPQPLKEGGIWDLRIGKSSELLPKINDDFDMFIHDSEHSYANMTFELEWAASKMKKGIIICDDAYINNAFNDFIKRHKNQVKLLNTPLAAVKLEAVQ
ncbi:MAG: class I SAM-dependent methyltransferase [Candidatus Micrarchaeia archaeon]